MASSFLHATPFALPATVGGSTVFAHYFFSFSFSSFLISFFDGGAGVVVTRGGGHFGQMHSSVFVSIHALFSLSQAKFRPLSGSYALVWSPMLRSTVGIVFFRHFQRASSRVASAFCCAWTLRQSNALATMAIMVDRTYLTKVSFLIVFPPKKSFIYQV